MITEKTGMTQEAIRKGLKRLEKKGVLKSLGSKYIKKDKNNQVVFEFIN